MPGSVATFMTCSSDRSLATPGSRARDAQTMPGTRIAPCRGIRNRYGVCSMSSICAPLPQPRRWVPAHAHGPPIIPVSAGPATSWP
jgi:hypothetical protein